MYVKLQSVRHSLRVRPVLDSCRIFHCLHIFINELLYYDDVLSASWHPPIYPMKSQDVVVVSLHLVILVAFAVA